MCGNKKSKFVCGNFVHNAKTLSNTGDLIGLDVNKFEILPLTK